MTIHIFVKKIIMEVWKDIKDYEGFYQISTLGKVRSLDRFINGRLYFGKELKLLDAYGYKSIQLRKNVTKGCFYIHRLVAEAFIENKNNYQLVNHKDENKINNNVNNLEWCNRSYNAIHSNNKNSSVTKIFSNDEVKNIRNRVKNGETIYKVSKDLKQNTGTISNIVNYKTYKNV